MTGIKRVAPLAILLGGAAIVVTVSLSATVAKPRASAAKSSPSKAAVPNKAANPLPEVKLVTAALLNQQIAAQKGKAVLVNFWATWCPGCVQEFPDLVKLQREYAAKGLTVLFVSADENSDVQKKVRPFLAKQGVRATSYVMKGDANQFLSQFDPKRKSAFSLPRTFLYDKQGKRVKEVEQVDFAEAAKLVEPLL